MTTSLPLFNYALEANLLQKEYNYTAAIAIQPQKNHHQKNKAYYKIHQQGKILFAMYQRKSNREFNYPCFNI